MRHIQVLVSPACWLVCENGSVVGPAVPPVGCCARLARRQLAATPIAISLCVALTLSGCTSGGSASPPDSAQAEAISGKEPRLRSDRHRPRGQIAFFRGDQAMSVFIVGVDGGEPERLTSLPEYSSAITWASDGARLAFDVGVSKGGFGLLRMVDVATGETRTLAKGRRTSHPSWSPIDDLIAVSTGDGEIWTIDVSTRKYRRLTTTRPACGDYDPTWSPRGQSLLFVRSCRERYWLMRLDLDATSPVRISGTGGALSPAWSPDGNMIAFQRSTFERRTQIYVVSANGGKARRLTRAGENFSPAWSPDGRFLAMVGKRAGNADILVMRLSDGRTWLVTDTRTREGDPAWRPASD